VAIIGSVFATSYRPNIADKLTALGAPADVITAAKDSVGGAIQAAGGVGGSLGRAISAAAKSEFVYGFHSALKVGALVTIVAAAIVWAFLPARASDVRPIEETPLDGIASLTFAEAEGVLEPDPATS